jgi:hypothetical protein
MHSRLPAAAQPTLGGDRHHGEQEASDPHGDEPLETAMTWIIMLPLLALATTLAAVPALYDSRRN